MNVRVIEIEESNRTNVVAGATVELTTERGERILIRDVRILRNKLDQLWVAMPSFSVSRGGRDFTYKQTVELDKEVSRAVSDAVLARYEQWAAQQAQGGGRQ